MFIVKFQTDLVIANWIIANDISRDLWRDNVYCDRPRLYVIKWKHFARYWPFVWGIHRWPVNSPHKGQWRRALMFSLIGAWINDSVNNGEVGDLRRHRAHYDRIVMDSCETLQITSMSVARPFWNYAQGVNCIAVSHAKSHTSLATAN